MKIIQLLQKPQLRGAEIFACQLSNHLLQQGHQVIVITIFSGDSKLPFGGKVINLDRPLSKRFYDIIGWKKFASIMKDFKPDIIQANAADTLKFAVSTKLFFSVGQAKLVFRNANKMGDFINTKFKWYLNNFYLGKVDFVISVSKECEKDFNRTFNYNSQKIKTVEIGVEDKEVGGVPIDLKDIFTKGPVLTHIGGFVPEKNHFGLISIFKTVKQNFPNAQLLLLGKGRLQDKIKETIASESLENDVHFLGYRNDVLEILKHSHLFVLPSLIEGLPGVILEAMFCETPVVAFNVGGVGEVVKTGETGWLVEKNDNNGINDSIKQILFTNFKEVKLPEVIKAKKMVTEQFLNNQIAKRFEECYKLSLFK